MGGSVMSKFLGEHDIQLANLCPNMMNSRSVRIGLLEYLLESSLGSTTTQIHTNGPMHTIRLST